MPSFIPGANAWETPRLPPAIMIDPNKARRWIERRRPSLVKALRERDGDICLFCDNPLDGEPSADTVAYWLDKGVALDGQKCWGCGETMPHESGQLHIDHIIPLSEGGTNDPDNLCLLHKCCNLSKQNFMSTTWFEERVREHLKRRPIMRFDERGCCIIIHPDGTARIYPDLTSSRWRE